MTRLHTALIALVALAAIACAACQPELGLPEASSALALLDALHGASPDTRPRFGRD